MEIRPITVDELKAGERLLAGYSKYIYSDMGDIDPQWEIYQKLIDAGMLTMTGVFDGELLVGVVIVIFNVSLHYGKPVAAVESIYVLPEYRYSGAGLTLIGKVEQQARSRDCACIMLSAPAGKELSRIASGMGYGLGYEVHIKCL